jgi:outer membrane lipoprotein-sorting protein
MGWEREGRALPYLLKLTAMRKTLLSLAVITALLSASGMAAAQTVDEIVAKAYKAKGGDKWKTIQSTRMTARITTQGMELPMTIVSRRPNMMRQDISIPMQGVTIVQAFDGTAGWMMNPMMGATAQDMPAAMAESMRDQADFDGPLVDYKAKGNTVELVGTEDVGGAKAYHLKVTKKGGQVQHLYIDVERGVEVKTVSEVDMGEGKTRVEQTLSDYRAVDGILVPFSMRVSGGPAGDVTLTVDKMEFNVALDETMFKKPAK